MAVLKPLGDAEMGERQRRMMDAMLARGWREERIRKVLGGNALRVLEDVRP